ncbi:SDR family oxidoreductase [Halomonas sp. BM-2019]|uniref:SDR family oxidoreductase n=1 Tax=Halomonas sp. BM-2019 TaxID=2811227 RepID=UPI001B3C3CC0|nr:MAG: SDR family oxidoreductase [Halomonas sp. BM-2019]
MKTTTLILGCGDIGVTLGQRLLAAGQRVVGVRRNAAALADSGLEAVSADFADPATLTELPDAEVLVYVASADRFEEEAYRAAYLEGLKAVLGEFAGRDRPPRRVFFVSSTSVYPQQAGEVVDEASPAEPSGFAGALLREAERTLLEHPRPGTVVRFSGIYGPGRDRLIRQVSEGRIAPASPAMYTNRIHRDDCAGVLAHLIERTLADEPVDDLYLASDCEPAPLHEVMAWLARQLKVEATETIQSPLRRRASKRCSNARLLASGYEFRYPSYREGYAQVLKEGGFLPEKA